MLKKPEITLIICTHNRADLLNRSLFEYSSIQSDVPYEILVVENACTDQTLEVVNLHQQLNSKIRLVSEPEIGHSNARNTGWKNALAPFVFYIDDDAFPHERLIDRLYNRLTENEIKCISGHTIYWPEGSPLWIRGEFVEVPLFRKNFGLLSPPAYINGCASGFSVETLEEIGGFDGKLGMKGQNLGYFDEIYVQERLRKKGVPIHYDPNLIVYHRSHFKDVWGFLKSAFIKGRNETQIKREVWYRNIAKACYYTIRGILNFPFNWLRGGLRVALITSFKDSFTSWGKVWG